MHESSMKKIVNVAAAVITRGTAEEQEFLLGQRAPGTFYPGYWEFPGGKVEAGESAHDAVVRELTEELGLQVHTAWPWITREHVYEHAHVRLHFFEVPQWSGEIRDHVHSALAWQRADALEVAPMLPANGPILKALRLPRCMGITQAHAIGIDAQLAALDGALARGLRCVQLREPDVALRETLAHAALPRCRAAGALFLVNGDLDLARRIGADGVHLPARLTCDLADRPDFEWVGASCHTREELETAARLGLDYAVLGPVAPTATHPGQPTLGWTRFADLSRELPLPVLAIGGLGAAHMPAARAAGAHGIASIRTAWHPAG